MNLKQYYSVLVSSMPLY